MLDVSKPRDEELVSDAKVEDEDELLTLVDDELLCPLELLLSDVLELSERTELLLDSVE